MNLPEVRVIPWWDDVALERALERPLRKLYAKHATGNALTISEQDFLFKAISKLEWQLVDAVWLHLEAIRKAGE